MPTRAQGSADPQSKSRVKTILGHLKDGNYIEVERLATSFTLEFPMDPFGWKALGTGQRQLGKGNAALVSIRKAAGLSPRDVSVKCTIGDLLKELDRPEEAEAYYRGAIAIQNDCVEAHNNLGTTLRELGRLKEAEATLRHAMSIAPDDAIIHNNLGLTLQGLSQHREAELSLRRAIALSPGYANAYNSLGVSLQALEKYKEAEAAYKKALAQRSDFAGAFNNLGSMLGALSRYQEAEDYLSQAVELNPFNAKSINNLGLLFAETHRLEEAALEYKKAIEIEPSYADAHNNMATTLRELARFDEAEEHVRIAAELDPCCAEYHFNASFHLLLQGRLEEGFQLYEWRTRLKEPISIASKSHHLWDMQESLEGKRFFVYAEQGLGDIIQFARYLTALEELGALVVFRVSTKLHKLLRSMDNHVQLTETTPEHLEIDFASPLMSLPHLFNTDLATIPASPAYLSVDTEKVSMWGRRLKRDSFKIGICWQGSKSKADVGRSFPLSRFESLAKIPNVELISLHKGEGESQIGCINFELTTFGPEFDAGENAFIDTAAVMKHCDLIISCDTAIVHLAGALGRPTWVALKYVPDWRWMLRTEKTPWYPSLRLYRQSRRDDWTSVFSEMRRDLIHLLDVKGVGFE